MGFARALQKILPGKTLYHYTSQSGLIGIVKNKSIWATHLYHLNDSSEFVYAFDLMNHKILKLREEVVNTVSVQYSLYRDMEQALQTYRKLPRRMGLFVGSFSEDGDLLSQWRGYCPDGFGYSIGFRIDNLEIAAKDQDFTLKKCIYDPKEQDRILAQILEKFMAEFDRVGSSIKSGYDEEKVDKIITEFLIIPLVLIAPLIKDYAFHEEKEWRLVSSATKSDNKQIKYRNGKSAIIPYYDFPLIKVGDVMTIDEIKISPSMNTTLATESLANYLISENVTVKEISPSKIPYRAS